MQKYAPRILMVTGNFARLPIDLGIGISAVIFALLATIAFTKVQRLENSL